MTGWPLSWWLAAGAAGLAAWLWTAGPPRRPDRVAERSGGVDEPADSGLSRFVTGRPDAVLPATRRWPLGAACGSTLTGAAHGWLGGWSLLLGLVVVGVVGLGLGWLEPASARRRRWSAVVQTPQVLDLLAAGLSAGLPLRSATSGVVAACPGPVADDLARVLTLIDLGMSDVAAWRCLVDHPQLGPVAVDLSRSVDSGTRLIATLTTHAADARAARRAAIEIEARKVGVRSVLPLMTCFIPAFLLLGVVPTVASALIEAFAGLG